MGARLALVFSRTHSGAYSNHFQTARQANNSLPPIYWMRRDCEPRLDEPDPSTHASVNGRFPKKRKGDSK